MLFRKCPLPIMGLLGTMIASASAQYIQNHQQLFIDAERLEGTNIQAKALEPIDDFDDEKSWLWTGNWQPNIFNEDLQIPLRPLLVKMNPNQPESNPFAVQWAMTYLFPNEDNGDPQPLSLEVQDVHHIPGATQYLLCGMFRKENTIQGGFLLKTDWLGYPTKFRYYPGIQILNSVVSKANIQAGHIAVGQTLSSQKIPGAAVFLSVGPDLNPTCVKQVHGQWEMPGMVNSFYKKVIPVEKNKRFAVVGATKLTPTQDSMLSTQDMLLSVFDESCNASCNNRFGNPTKRKVNKKGVVTYTQLYEDGESVAEEGFFKSLVITGTTRKIVTRKNKSRIVWTNILLFKVTAECKLKFARHYDVDKKDDFGLAIQVRGKEIVIAGQSNNQFLSGNTDPKVKTNDVVLLTTKLTNGALLSAELFGGEGSEGRNRGGWMDLHLSHDATEQYPIVLANTMQTWPSAGINNPYLIERYDDTEQNCYDTDVKEKAKKYKAKQGLVKEWALEVHSPEMDIKGKKVDIKQKIICDKKK